MQTTICLISQQNKMELKLKDNSNNPEEYWEGYKRETSIDRKLGDQ